METMSHKVIIAITIVLGLTSAISCAVVTSCPCRDHDTDSVNMPPNKNYDTCTAAGTFKSKSICYRNQNNNDAVVKPYEYYTCVPYGTSFILYPRKCNVRRWVIEDADIMSRFFNPYNPANGLCDLPPPTDATAPDDIEDFDTDIPCTNL